MSTPGNVTRTAATAALIGLLAFWAHGCSGDGSRSQPNSSTSVGASTSASAGTGSSASGSASAPASAVSSAPAGPVFDPATTVTVVAGGIDVGGPSSTRRYGIVEPRGGVLKDLAALMGVPTGDVAPTAPNQFSEIVFYGSQPPPYYSASDIAEVDRAQRGIPRYALIVAKGIREVLDRSGAKHVNLVGASLGGVISRYLIEKDLEGLASGGKIVRWLTVESTAGGAYLGQILTQSSVTIPLLSLLAQRNIDATDFRTSSYDFVERELNTPDSRRSTSPFFATTIVGHQISSDFNVSPPLLTALSGLPNDGVLLVRDQRLHRIDAKPLRGPAVVVNDTNHDSLRHDPGAHAALVNFLRSRRRATVRIVSAEVRTLPERASHGDGEVVFAAKITSPEALREWGVTDELATVNGVNGSAAMHPFARNQSKPLDEVLFDWFVAPGEQRLILELSAYETDYNLWYGVFEELQAPPTLMDRATVDLPVATPGSTTLTVDTPSFRAEIRVEVVLE